MTFRITRTASKEDFVERACSDLTKALNKAIDTHGQAILGLSGGSTPGPVYEALGARTDIDWARVIVFLVDERFVASDDLQSNTNLVRSTLLLQAKIPTENLLFPNTKLPLDECVAEYEKRLGELLLQHSADVVVLGMGEDGHTASLFPGDEKAITEAAHLALHTTTETLAVHDRITVTVPVLARAESKILLISGEKKLAIVESLEKSEDGIVRWPLKALGDVTVFYRP